MKTILFNQWINRFFEFSEFSRDLMQGVRVRDFLRGEYDAGREPMVAVENFRNAVWREELP